MKSTIPSLIDTVELVDITVQMLGPKESIIPGAQMHAKYNLIASSTGMRLGQATANIEWSPDTQQKLKDLIQAIESDVCERVFGLAHSTSSGDSSDDPNEDGVGGL